MTISTTVNKVVGQGNGATTVFSYSFLIPAAINAVVTLTDSFGNQTVLLPTQYGITGLGNAGGGTLTYPLMGSPITSGMSITLQRVVPLQQLTSLNNQNGYYPQVVEGALDYLELQIQQVASTTGGNTSLQFPSVDPLTLNAILPAAAARANMLLSFDGSGNVSVVAAASQSATALATQLANSGSASQGSGQVGFAYAVAYAAGTVGAWLQALATSVGSSFIGWIQAGTGAVLRTLQAKARDVVNVKDFGAVLDGVTNDIAAVQAAHDYVATFASGGAIVFPPGAVCKCNTTLTWNPNKVAVVGNGVEFDFTSLTAGAYAITLNQTTSDVNARHGQNRAHPFDSAYLIGPGGTVTATSVKMVDPTGSNSASGVQFRNCSFVNFYRDVEFGNGAFLNVFLNCDFFITGGTGYDTILYNPVATNGGENNEFVTCNFNKSAGSLIRQTNPNATTVFRGCSGDYMQMYFDVQAGEVDWDGYLENSTDTAYWCKVSGQNTLLRVAGRMTITGNKTAFEIFYSDPTCTNGGLLIDLSIQWGAFTSSLDYCAVGGTGRVRANFRAHSNSSVHPALGGGSNVMGNGGFESAALTDWTLAGGTPPNRSATVAHSGTYSLRFQGITGQNNSASRSIPCSPGQQMVGSLWWQAPALTGTGATFYVLASYLDAGGASLQGSAIVTATANAAGWVKVNLGQLAPAPTGTASASLSVSIFGTTSGAPIGYIDDVTMAVV